VGTSVLVLMGMIGHLGTGPHGHDWTLRYWSLMNMCEG
jgi:hypothetical protein